MTKVSSYFCWRKGLEEYGSMRNAVTAAQARYDYYLAVSDYDADCRYIDVRCRKAGPPVVDESFVRCARSRGVSLRQGDKVLACGKEGFVLRSDSSANFVVSVNGVQSHYHPSDIVRLQ